MKKLTLSLVVIVFIFSLIGCSKTNNDQNPAPEITIQAENDIIEASEEVQLWAQYELDSLTHMLTVDGFFKDDNQSGSLITIDIEEKKITNLELVKRLEFHDNTTVDLYLLDFKLLPENLTDQSLFKLDDSGWITSDNNFTISDANGYEAKKGQLYLLIHNNDGEITSMGIRRAETLTEKWCKDLLAYYNYPMGVNFNMSEEEIQDLQEYWKWEADWSFTMPCYNGYGDTWNVGLGYANEWGVGIPHEYIGSTDEPAQDLVAYTFSTINRIYYDGLTVISFRGFYGDDPDGIGFAVNQYISCTQPDCKTSRGIHVGDSVETLCAAYPEVYQNEDYLPDYNEESGVAAHDDCWIYTSENSNRSILFLIKNNIIVQIDMADGLDGQITAPSWTGTFGKG